MTDFVQQLPQEIERRIAEKRKPATSGRDFPGAYNPTPARTAQTGTYASPATKPAPQVC